MQKLVLGICVALAVAAPAARAAEPTKSAAAVDPTKSAAAVDPTKSAVAVEPTKSAVGVEMTGWAEPGPADLVVLEGLEGENLAEARNTKGTKLEIQSTKKDLDGDGIPELFFFVKHPMFCYEELGGCSLLVIHRASLSDPWQEIGVITAPAPSLVVAPARSGEFPTLRPLGSQPYTWNGRLYQAEPGGAPAVPVSEAGKQ